MSGYLLGAIAVAMLVASLLHGRAFSRRRAALREMRRAMSNALGPR